MFLFARPINAADIAVDEFCSLTDAIRAANSDAAVGGCPAGDGADVITLTSNVTLWADLPRITTEITVEGAGFSISGNSAYRIFFVEASGELTLSHLTLADGKASDVPLPSGEKGKTGGAIINAGILTVNSSRFADNSADHGGAMHNLAGAELSILDSVFTGNTSEFRGGAIINPGSLVISNSTFSGNSTNWAGGAISNSGEGKLNDSTFSDNSAVVGGAVVNFSELSVSHSAFSDNTADERGGAFDNWASLSISNSSIIGNIAKESGGAIHSEGELILDYSTIGGNSADVGSGIYIFGDYYDNATATLTHVTLAQNVAGVDALMVVGEAPDAMVNLRNSIIAANKGGNCYGDLNENISNLIEDGTCDAKLSGNPMLGDLIEPEDGSPAYFPLLPGSPAIDAASSDYCPQADQIGTPRPQGESCDIGAIEFIPEN